MIKRSALVTLVVLFLLTLFLGLTGISSRIWSSLAGIGDRWRAGFFALAHAGSDEAQDPVHPDQILRLAAENAELRQRIREYRSIYAEVGTRIFPEQLLRARIVARSSDRGRHFLEIDRGALHGVQVGDPVLAGWTLVGVVRAEHTSRALVQQLSDRQSRVAVAIFPASLGEDGPPEHDAALAQGVLAGLGRRDAMDVIHVEMRPERPLEAGMQVLTSGLDEQIPFGLAVGQIIAVEQAPDSSLWNIQLAPLRPWGTYPTVLVLRHRDVLGESTP